MRYLTALLACLLLAMPALADETAEAPVGANGLHTQAWFHEGFLELGDDLAEAADAGKDLIVLIEQAGCPYCRELHRVNLRDPDITATMKDNFMVVQLDLRGSREVVDFDGEAMEERDLVRKWGILFTPTVLFIPADAIDMSGDGKARTAVAMPGYFKPFHFDAMLHYVMDDAYKPDSEHAGDFQRYLGVHADRLRAEGKEISVW
jgi:thioredoxin-related protein